jgi:hypothetical protein
MRINATAHPRRASLAWSAVRRASRLSIFGFIGWTWFLLSDDPGLRTVSLVAVLALAALVGITWYLVASAPNDGGGLHSIAPSSKKRRSEFTHEGGNNVEGD